MEISSLYAAQCDMATVGCKVSEAYTLILCIYYYIAQPSVPANSMKCRGVWMGNQQKGVQQ